MPSILGVAVIEVKNKVFDVLRVLEVKVHSGAYSTNLVFLELLQVMGKIVATDPYLVETILVVEDLLATIIVTSLAESKHSLTLMDF